MAKANTPKTIVLNDDYDHFRGEFLDAVRRINSNTLVATWDLGDIYSSYVGDNSSYGKNVAEKLATDLVESGLSATLESAKTLVYVSSRIANMFSRVKLLEMASRNMTLTHARMLTTVRTPELLDDVLEQMFQLDENGNDRVVPTTNFADFIRSRAQAIGVEYAQRLSKNADEIAKADTLPVDDGPEDQVDDLPPPSAPRVPQGEISEPTPAGPNVAEPFAGGQAQGTANSGSASAEGGSSERLIESPLKTLKEFEKLATRLTVMCADLVLAVGAADKDGFDTERTEANFREAFEMAKAAGADLVTALPSTLQSISGYKFEALRSPGK